MLTLLRSEAVIDAVLLLAAGSAYPLSTWPFAADTPLLAILAASAQTTPKSAHWARRALGEQAFLRGRLINGLQTGGA